MLTEEERKIIKAEQEENDRRQNCKQHCTKIRDGLDKLDEYSSARAIWELVQNARDLSTECEIEISLTENEFVFAHKGKPFTHDSLGSLVKQVSSQEKEDEDNNAVGQYGTGFITTHSFSRVIRIDGSFKIRDGLYVDIDNFEIDRQFEHIDEFIEKMSNQIKQVSEFVDKPTTSVCREWTKLKYELNAESLVKAEKGLSEAERVIPIVLTLNNRIKKITINNIINHRHILYCKEETTMVCDELYVTPIIITDNGQVHRENCFSLESKDFKDKIILPLETMSKAKSFDGIPKLFLFFPLLGTENFGMNFIFHSERFQPVEARNGIHLPNVNKTAENKYETNVSVLNEMSDMLFAFLSKRISGISNAIELSSIDFDISNKDEKQKDFFKELQKKWVAAFINYPIIETDHGKFCISQTDKVKVLKNDITIWLTEERIADYLPSIYSFAKNYSNLPFQKEIIRWSKIIEKWGLEDNGCFVSMDNIASTICSESDHLHKLIEFICGSQKSEFLNKYPLIPNREGKLWKASELKNAVEINDIFYNIAKKIIPDVAKTFVNNTYNDVVDLSKYPRINFRDDVNSRINNISRLDRGECFDKEFEDYIVEYCSIFNTENGTSQRNNLMPIICELCDISYNETVIPKITTDEPDLYETAFKYLVRNQFQKIDSKSNCWDNMDLLKRFLLECVKTETFKKDIATYSLFPNQNGKLCKKDDLYINKDVDNDLLNFYQKATDNDLKDNLIDEDFSKVCDFKEYDSKQVANVIEKELQNCNFESQLTIDIIEKLDEKPNWKGIFLYIEKNKEELFYKQAVQGNNKKNVYKIMKCDSDTLQMLAELSDNPRAKDILDKAKQLIEHERYKQADFDFKHDIGVHIEKIIKERIQSDIKIEYADIEDVQNGQDLIVSYNDKPIYYIEVKAKWNFNEPAHMSRNQMKKAFENKDRYALCCVDLSHGNWDDHFYPDINTIIDNIFIHTNIGEELSPIMTGVAKQDSLNDDEVIKMGGDYRCNIFKKVFKNGTPFSSLINKITETIDAYC